MCSFNNLLFNRYGEQETKLTIRVENYDSLNCTPSDNDVTSSEAVNTHLPRARNAYSRLQSLGRFVRSFGGHQSLDAVLEDDDVDNEEFDGDSEEEQEECENKYLQRVCDKIQEKFRVFKGIRKISCEYDEVIYKLPKLEVPLSMIFDLMEKMKSDPSFHIVNYSVSQSTLEQVSIVIQNKIYIYNR